MDINRGNQFILEGLFHSFRPTLSKYTGENLLAHQPYEHIVLAQTSPVTAAMVPLVKVQQKPSFRCVSSPYLQLV